MSSTDRIKQAQRHERLRELMTDKVQKMACGPRRLLSEAEREFVEHEVDLLLHTGDARESSLSRIAAQLKVLNPSKPPSVVPDAASTISSTKGKKSRSKVGTSGNPHQVANAAAPADVADESTSRGRARRGEEDPWAKLCEKNVEEFNREITNHRRVVKKKEEEQHRFLDTQVEFRKQVKAKAIEEEKRFAVEEAKQRVVWEEEEKKKIEAKKKKFAEAKAIRDEQLEIAKVKKEREAEVVRLEGLEIAKQLAIDYEKEQEANKLKKIKAKEEVAKAQAFNIQFREKKAAEIGKEAEIEKRHQAMFLERLEKQERQRDENLLKMQDRQRKQQIMAGRMETTMAEQSAEDERKAQAYVEKVEARRIAEEKAKQEKAALEKVKMRQHLTLQMMRKEEQRAKERDELQKQRDQIAKEISETERKEAERKLLERQKVDKHRVELEEQLFLRSQVKKVLMSDNERRLNAKLLN